MRTPHKFVRNLALITAGLALLIPFLVTHVRADVPCEEFFANVVYEGASGGDSCLTFL